MDVAVVIDDCRTCASDVCEKILRYLFSSRADLLSNYLLHDLRLSEISPPDRADNDADGGVRDCAGKRGNRRAKAI